MRWLASANPQRKAMAESVSSVVATQHCLCISRFKGIVKAIRDNCTEHSLTTHQNEDDAASAAEFSF